MCIESVFECDMQAYGSCDKVLMREMRMEILIVVSALTCGVIVHLCTCAFRNQCGYVDALCTRYDVSPPLGLRISKY